MRAMELTVGIVLIIVGALILLAINGTIALAIADIAGIALIASGIFFIVPGLYWRRGLPWLTSLFIPGLLAVAAGAIVIYARHAGWGALWYLWVGLPVVIGLAFLGMYYLGPHERWLWLVGIWIGGISLFLLAILLVLLSPIFATRVAGSAILILLGLIVAARAVVPRRPSTQLAPRE
jgi:hypothetical protein